MKRNALVFGIMAAAILCSCGGKTPVKPVFNNQIDSVSYCFGMARTNGFIEYLAGQMGVDTTYMNDFRKGFMEGALTKSDDQAKKAYLAGLQIAQNEIGNVFNQLGASLFVADTVSQLNRDNYINGFLDGACGNFSIMTREKASIKADSLYEVIYAKQMETKYADNLEAGKKFIADKAKEEGVIALESGVLYKIIKQGNGAIPTRTDKVKAIYEGRLIDGTVFDSSEEGVDFPVTGVIKGWTEILQLMPVGSKWQVYIPQELAYGERETGSIKPFSALEFDIELVKIVNE